MTDDIRGPSLMHAVEYAIAGGWKTEIYPVGKDVQVICRRGEGELFGTVYANDELLEQSLAQFIVAGVERGMNERR